MIRFWRITLEKLALDKKCDGARTQGGRWNPVGVPALYAGTTPEICALEKFVHLAGVGHPSFKLVAIDVPDSTDLIYAPAHADLPLNWAASPPSADAQVFGKAWVEAATHLVMLVPAAVIPEARNAVINPLHPEYQNVTLKIIRDFTFDARMFKGSFL